MYTITLKDNTCNDFTLTCECTTHREMRVWLMRIKTNATRLVKDGTLTVIDHEDGLILREYKILNGEITRTIAQGD